MRFVPEPWKVYCEDRSPGQQMPKGGTFTVFEGERPPYERTRLATLEIPEKETPALTVAAEPNSWTHIAVGNPDAWKIYFCAEGLGSTDQEARVNLDRVEMYRTGALLTVTAGMSNLWIEAPQGAPVTVHKEGAVDVRDLSGPVRIASTGGRVTILNTTGTVDAQGQIIDYAGARGHVMLTSPDHIAIKMTAEQFDGGLSAYAQRKVQAYFPRGFRTKVQVFTEHPKAVVCRADFCSHVVRDRHDGFYWFTYAGNGPQSEQLSIRSDGSTELLEAGP